MLTGLARDKLDDATQTLGSVQQNLLAAQQQLTMLEDYLLDYRKRLQSAVQQGLSAAGWQNYQRFIATLEGAIREQRNVVSQVDRQVDAARDSWRACKQRLNSFDTLSERRARVEAISANRREQRDNDEFSARMMRQRAGHGSLA